MNTCTICDKGFLLPKSIVKDLCICTVCLNVQDIIEVLELNSALYYELLRYWAITKDRDLLFGFYSGQKVKSAFENGLDSARIAKYLRLDIETIETDLAQFNALLEIDHDYNKFISDAMSKVLKYRAKRNLFLLSVLKQ
jgi:predicted transcriptional regulator